MKLEPWELETVTTWEEIKGKAHYYKTARLRDTGEYVALCSIIQTQNGLALPEPMFFCRIAFTETYVNKLTSELFSFVL
jgi:hypothetical protein